MIILIMKIDNNLLKISYITNYQLIIITFLIIKIIIIK